MGKKKPVHRRTFQRILELKCFEMVVQMLLSGYPVSSIADYIQKVKGESTDIKQTSLLTILSDFRNTLPLGDAIAPFHPKRVIELQKDFDDLEQDLRDITWAIDVLKENVAAGYQTVADSGYPSKNLQIDVDALGRMIMRRHEIKMDLGLGRPGGRNLGTINIAPAMMRKVQDKHGQVFDEILSNPEKLSQVVSGATRLLAAAEGGEVIDVKPEDDSGDG